MELLESNTGRVEHFRTKIVNVLIIGALERDYACLLLTRGALEGARERARRERMRKVPKMSNGYK